MTAMLKSFAPLGLLLLAACAVTPGSGEGRWWEPASGPVPLEEVLGGQPGAWVLRSGAYEVAPDGELGAPVLTAQPKQLLGLEGRTRYEGSWEIRLRLRLGAGEAANASASLQAGLKEDARGFQFNLAAAKATNTITATLQQEGKPLHDLKALAESLDWTPTYSNSFAYRLRAYQRILPGWEASYRAGIEDAMWRLPDLASKWVDVRLQLAPGRVRGWLDDRLVAIKDDPGVDPAGTLKLTLSPGVQVASFAVVPWSPSEAYLPIPLAGYANRRELLRGAEVKAGSLPPANVPVEVGGIPFVFPGVNLEGNDHIDVGESYLRQANMQGYVQTSGEHGRWNGAAFRDPARIQLRLPNGSYDHLYLIAAADGEAPGVPLVSAMFYRPAAGFAETFESSVPLATAKSSEAAPLPVTLSNGQRANLWLVKIPLDPARLTAFADLDIVEVELTKQVHLYRSYPDPISYGYHQGGEPSGVHIYAATLGLTPVVFEWKPARFGDVWETPEVPAYTARLRNRGTTEAVGRLSVTTRSHDGTETTTIERPVKVGPGKSAEIEVKCPVKLNGYHEIEATLDLGGRSWTEKRSMVRLAANTRSPEWTPGKGALFSYWSYRGGHHTPKGEHHERLMGMAGARSRPATMGNAWFVTVQPWAGDESPDPAKVAAFQEEVVKKVKEWEQKRGYEADDLYCFPEPHISPRLTAGNWPEYWNGTPFVYTDQEKENLARHMGSAKLAAQAYRAAFPGRKILIPWGDPLYVVAFLRNGFPTELVDGSALDIPGFERLPERQLHEQSIHRLFILREEFAKAGIREPRLQFNEGIFVPTEPGSVSWREQMDIYHRWTLLSMAYGVDRFYSGWFAFDCGNYYGAEHYGGCGIQRRIPYGDPKPAYAAYATMTQVLDGANFDGWEATGSHSTYCLRFKHETRGAIYALWTLRGQRPVTLTLAADATVGVIDSMNNERPTASRDRQLTVTTDASVIYLTGAGEVTGVAVGEPDHGDAQPAGNARPLADLGDGSWRLTGERDEIYERNHWAMDPAPGRFSTALADDPVRGRVLVTTLEPQERTRELMPWYTVLRPARPIRLEGAPSHLGLWVRGASDWGRFIYVLRDAAGERWISIGTRDQYNCDDPHSWSSFNFDGWRYLRFELPGHLGWDSFRLHGTTWWRSDFGDTVVDLPLSLEAILIEQRTHLLYVNDVQPAAANTAAFGKLFVEYASPADASREAVAASRLRMPLPTAPANLPNPIADRQRDGTGAPTRLVGLTPPTHYYDGTRMHVHFEEVANARAYHLWVGPHADGRGAVNLVPAGIRNGALVTGLRAGVRLYYWLAYTDAEGRESKPSPVHTEITVDNFKEK